MNQRQQKQRWKRPCRTIVGVGYSFTNKKEKPRPPTKAQGSLRLSLSLQLTAAAASAKASGGSKKKSAKVSGKKAAPVLLQPRADLATASSAASAKASGGGKRLMLPVNKTPTHMREQRGPAPIFIQQQATGAYGLLCLHQPTGSN